MSTYYKILVVEDEKNLATNIAEYFESIEYDMDYSGDGLTALHLLSANRYDLLVLDLMLPGVSGFDIISRIRSDLKSQMPIIVTTARETLQDKERCFVLGVDDYLVKPFDLRELELRIEALLRRRENPGNVLKAGNLNYDIDRLQVSKKGFPPLVLSGLSARLLEVLLRAYPGFLEHEELSQHVWGREEVDPHTLRTQIYSLRQQLQKAFGESYIVTVHGRGYRLEAIEQPSNRT